MTDTPSPEALRITEADREAAEKFVRDWDGSDSIRGALAALLAQTRIATINRLNEMTVEWLRSVYADQKDHLQASTVRMVANMIEAGRHHGGQHD